MGYLFCFYSYMQAGVQQQQYMATWRPHCGRRNDNVCVCVVWWWWAGDEKAAVVVAVACVSHLQKIG